MSQHRHGQVFFGWQGQLVALDANTGEKVWSYAGVGGLTAPVVGNNGYVYCGAGVNPYFFAFNEKGNGDGTTNCLFRVKMAGRVGDSPIIGGGLFVDNEIGGATATGLGEEVLKTVGSFLIVELMRQGRTPQEACEEGVKRIVSSNPNYKNFQVGYVALNKKGEFGSYCIHPGFGVSKYQEDKQTYIASGSYIQKK